MRSVNQCSRRRVAGIIREALAEGHEIEIEEDVFHAPRLYRAFEKSGLQPWLDKEKTAAGAKLAARYSERH